MSTAATVLIVVLAVVIGGALIAVWWVDARRAKRVEADPQRTGLRGRLGRIDEERLRQDEERYAELQEGATSNPYNRLR
ncbi:MAG: hypothetical protein QM572_00405 [Nocardioides sp.]|uniref:hypothetical protein n=1 Tax=Nocardioides sp. TaxID=35761 RepID=UPI0039E6C456